jgi:transcriptional regulator of acetoin/glycerol metabolism
MSDEQKAADLLATMDAQVWAREFRAKALELGARGEDILEESWLIAWFANAIMAGHAGLERSLFGTAEEPKTVQEIEACAIRHALGLYDGNMSAAARHLGIDRRTLYRRVGSQKQRRQRQVQT